MVRVVEQVGSVADLHARDPFIGGAPADVEIWWCRPTDDAIVLGSRQPDGVVDPDACARAGLSVVRRRSGGGAVILRRDAMLWLDVVAPHSAPRDDVRASMVWVGEAWRAALAPLVDGDLRVHRGGMIETPWSGLVCFAGVGPGEVLLGADKLVGLSQRRTRHGIRVQCLVSGVDVGAEYPVVLTPPLPSGAPGGQAHLAGWASFDTQPVIEAFARRISPV